LQDVRSTGRAFSGAIFGLSLDFWQL